MSASFRRGEVTEQVERQHGEKQRSTGKQHVPPLRVEVLGGVRDHPAPARGRRGDAHPEERERRLEQDRLRDEQARVDDDRRGQVRQDLAEDDATVRGAERARGEHELALAQRQHLTTHDARDRGPADDRDHDDHGAQPRPHGTAEAAVAERAGRGDADPEQQHRERQHDVEQPREQRVDPAAEVAGEQADHDADDDREGGSDDPDEQ
jgi:hypothetical protein